MSFSEELANRIRSQLETLPYSFEEKRMFGGLSFLYKGKMTVGIIKDELAVRVRSEKMKDVLSNPFVRPMDFTKKPMKEFIYVGGEGFHSEEKLAYWIELGLEHAQSKL